MNKSSLAAILAMVAVTPLQAQSSSTTCPSGQIYLPGEGCIPGESENPTVGEIGQG